MYLSRRPAVILGIKKVFEVKWEDMRYAYKNSRPS